MPDRDGYPTDEELERVEAWDCIALGYSSLLEYVRSIWWNADWGIHVEGKEWRISTGGWSGNESIVGAMKSNRLFWSMCWLQSRRGGHYIFEDRQ